MAAEHSRLRLGACVTRGQDERGLRDGRHRFAGGVRDPDSIAADRQTLGVAAGGRRRLQAKVILVELIEQIVRCDRDPDGVVDGDVADPPLHGCLGDDPVRNGIDLAEPTPTSEAVQSHPFGERRATRSAPSDRAARRSGARCGRCAGRRGRRCLLRRSRASRRRRRCRSRSARRSGSAGQSASFRSRRRGRWRRRLRSPRRSPRRRRSGCLAPTGSRTLLSCAASACRSEAIFESRRRAPMPIAPLKTTSKPALDPAAGFPSATCPARRLVRGSTKLSALRLEGDRRRPARRPQNRPRRRESRAERQRSPPRR